jgi:hypothetical protein
MTSIAGYPQRKSRARHTPGDIYQWASQFVRCGGLHALGTDLDRFTFLLGGAAGADLFGQY